MLYDLFICHAWEDKDSFVRPLAEALRTENVELWYDEFSLKLGDSIRRSIDKGLRQSRFGIVVLSKAFFEKEWPQYELDGLADREMRGKDKVILPIWHNDTHDEVMTFSPSLACRKAVLSARGLDKIVSEILAVVRPQGSPLIIARDTLLKWGITPPVITDEKSPLCDELWVLRHPAFGNYEPAYVANAYFAGGIFGPDVSPYEHADHLFWLLSSASSWLPPHIHHVLVEGMKTWTAWPWYNLKIDADKNWATHEALWEGILDAVHGGEFRWTDAIQDDILHRIEYSIEVLDLPDSEDLLLRHFREHRFCERLIEEMKDRQQRQAKNQGKNSIDVQNP